MVNLREKAHASLSQFRNTPPSRQGTLHSEPNSPAHDNDELSVLGGRTRLAAPNGLGLEEVEEEKPADFGEERGVG